MKRVRIVWLVGVLALTGSPATAAQWRAGVARTDITPTTPICLAGYANRKPATDGILHPLWAKALTLADSHANRVVIVTLDLIGDNFERKIGDAIGTRVKQRTGIDRDHIVLNFSHTHCGPISSTCDGAIVSYHPDAQQIVAINAYTRTLENKLVDLIANTCNKMVPCKMSFGQGKATFAMNRRTLRDGRYVIAPNPKGPVDHTVPVLQVADENGRMLAVLFGYACHNTTLGGDYCRYNGDYAGFAQIALEAKYPGVTAMFMQGCGGDINPEPRGRVEHAEQHGNSLAGAVAHVLGAPMHPLHGPLAIAFTRIAVPFVDPPSKQELEKQRATAHGAEQRLAAVLLRRIAREGKLNTAYPYPVQVIRFGNDLSIIGLAGEVVVDYALRLRREFAGERVWIAGYCNEVFAYIPSERVLGEGGYEAAGAMKYFGWYGPFKPGVEQRIVSTVDKLMQRCRQDCNRQMSTKNATHSD